MRHQKHHASLGVTREHRASMLSNLAAALITHGRIQTTFTKAKALRPFIEKVITKAKRAAAKTVKADAVTSSPPRPPGRTRRGCRNAPFSTRNTRSLTARPGGYTRIYKLSTQRLGDAAGDGPDRVRQG